MQRCIFRPEVLVTPTQDLGKILTALHNVKITGKTNFVSTIQVSENIIPHIGPMILNPEDHKTSLGQNVEIACFFDHLFFSLFLQVAQLALKHRQNKNQRQRIIAFVGSPLEDDSKELVKLGKKLKKNNVAVDVVNFGETAENQEKLEAFIAAVNSNDNSNLLTVPPGPHILSDIIISSPILQDGEGGGGAAMGAGGMGMMGMPSQFDYGVDPSLDPELAMALRISAEEERQRQERQSKASEAEGEGAVAQTPAAATTAAGGDAMDEDNLLQQALAMSMQQAAASTPARPAAPAGGVDISPGTLAAVQAMDEEDEELKLAMSMSMAETAAAMKDEAHSSGLLQDAGFLSNVLSSLPGVDTSDPRVQNVLDGMKKEDEGKEGDKSAGK